MKKINYIILSCITLVCLLAFASCKDNDDDHVKPMNYDIKKAIVNTWTLEMNSLRLTCEPQSVANSIKEYYTKEKGAFTFQFTADGNYTITLQDGDVNDKGTYQVVKNNILLTSTIDESGDQKTLSFLSYDDKDGIKKLQLIIKLKYDLLKNAQTPSFWQAMGVKQPSKFVINDFTGMYQFVAKDVK